MGSNNRTFLVDRVALLKEAVERWCCASNFSTRESSRAGRGPVDREETMSDDAGRRRPFQKDLSDDTVGFQDARLKGGSRVCRSGKHWQIRRNFHAEMK